MSTLGAVPSKAKDPRFWFQRGRSRFLIESSAYFKCFLLKKLGEEAGSEEAEEVGLEVVEAVAGLEEEEEEEGVSEGVDLGEEVEEEGSGEEEEGDSKKKREGFLIKTLEE